MNIRPSLVIDRDTKKLCMQIRIGSFTATEPLPEGMASWTMNQLQDYFDKRVPEMIENLTQMKLEDDKKLRRKHS